MRRIGTISEPSKAQLFVDYLFANGLEAQVEGATDDRADIWVLDEDRLDEVRTLLERFEANPEDPVFVEAGHKAEQKRREMRHAQADFMRKVRDAKQINRTAWLQAVPVTRVLIAASIVATLFGGLGSGAGLTQWLSITEYAAVEGRLIYETGFPEILQGQIWRLITPIFLHASLLNGGFGILHILFNMLWLLDLGGMVERVQGGRGLLSKVLVIGFLSNLLQYALAGPAFGGMSGVVFGLLGYMWVRGRLDLTSGLFVSSQTMFMMTFWFFLGLSGAIGPIANAAHGGGLVTGLLWGYVDAQRVNRTARKH